MSNEITTRKFLTESEEKSLREDLRLCSLRDRLILQILLDLGPRGAELREIRPEDIDLKAKSIEIRGKKGSRSRQFPLSGVLLRDLEAFIKERDCAAGEPIFAVSATTLKEIWYRVRPNKAKGIHSLRHTFAVRLYERTRDIRLVQIALGHRSINSTMVYADFVDSKETMRRVFLQGGPNAS